MDFEKIKNLATRRIWTERITELIVVDNMSPADAIRCIVVVDFVGGRTLTSPPVPSEMSTDEAVRAIIEQAVEACGQDSTLVMIGYDFGERAFFVCEYGMPTAPPTVSDVDIEQMVGMIPDSPDEIKW